MERPGSIAKSALLIDIKKRMLALPSCDFVADARCVCDALPQAAPAPLCLLMPKFRLREMEGHSWILTASKS